MLLTSSVGTVELITGVRAVQCTVTVQCVGNTGTIVYTAIRTVRTLHILEALKVESIFDDKSA